MSDVGSCPDLLKDLGGTCSSFVGVGRSVGAASAAARCEPATETLAAASCPRPDCWPAPDTEGTSCNGDVNGTACTPETAQERPAVALRSTPLLDDEDDGCGNGDDDESRSPPPLAGAASLLPAAAATTRRLASRPHYGGLLYHHHHFPTTASRMKRKVLCAAAASLASPDSLAHEGLGGGKIRVSEERVSRQLQQLRLAGAGGSNVDGSSVGGGVCQLQQPVPSTPIGTAEGAAPLCEALPPAARGSQRTPDRRPASSGGRPTSSFHPRLPKHRFYDARRLPFASLQAARLASCPGLAQPPPLGQLPVAAAAPSAAAIDAPPRWSPDNVDWSWTECATAVADEMDATASCRAVMLSPPLVVWQSDEKPADKSPALGPVEPPPRPSSERRMLTLAAPDILSRDGGRRGGSLLQQQPTLQVPANEAERSSSPPPSALINPDEEGVCVVLTVTQCNDTADDDDKPEAADQCMEH